MTQFSAPSQTFPGPPRVSVEVPDDWTAVPMAGTVLAARGPLVDGLASNVVVRHYTRPLTFTVPSAMADLKAFVDQQPEGEIDEPFTLTLGEVPVIGVNISWTDPKAGDIVQVHLFAGTRLEGLVHLVQVTGSVGGTEIETDYDQVQGILQTVRIER